MVNKIKVAPAEPPEKPVGESADQDSKSRDENDVPEKIPTKNKVLYGLGAFTAVVALVLVITLPIVLKSPPESLQSPGWEEWTEWSRCSSSCDQGQRSRMRFCSDGKGGTGDVNDCPGDAVDIENCYLTKCLSGRAMVKSTCTHLRQTLNMTDNLFCDRYAQSVTLNGEVINSSDAAEEGYGVWRLTEKDLKRILGYYYFQMVKIACGTIPGFSPSISLNETLKLVNEQPCLSAVAWVAHLKIEDLLPIPIVFAQQETILKDTTSHIMMTWDKTMATERQEMQDMCLLADIDFDFIIDASGSIGQSNWEETMNNIADYWITVIQPNGAEHCGNHVAARWYSGASNSQLSSENNYHKRWLDFKPPPKSQYENFPNYTAYVQEKFRKEPYKKGATHTAEALKRVRLDDMTTTRGGQTFAMIFTDGMSNDPKIPDWPILENEAKFLQHTVDEVYAYGIGNGANEDELKLIATRDEGGWYIMDGFETYQYTIDMFILQQGGCDTQRKKPFRKSFKVFRFRSAIYWSYNMTHIETFIRARNIFDRAYGLSQKTAIEQHPSPYCGMGCETSPETDRPSNCIKCSKAIADIDIMTINKYWSNITQVANEKCFPAAIIAAIISRETRGGIEHLDEDGWSLCQNAHYYFDHYQRCYGIMHLPDGN